jgi:hypothetical protein
VFNTSKKQFINILQQNKQLKIYYKTIQDAKIIQEDESSFLITNYDALPNDAQSKLNTLQKKIKPTYFAALLKSPNQNIVPTNRIDTINYNSINIANNKSIIIPKNEIISMCSYFESTGIDFILSPYTIIEDYLIDNAKKNSLTILIYNNIIYAIIYKEKEELFHIKINILTPFESTQDITFIEDNILGQKLYEEVKFLEIQHFLTETIENYYIRNHNVNFLEHIEILYTLKPLSDIQVASLEEIIMIPIHNSEISLNEYMDNITQSKNANFQNFITPRVKTSNKSIYLGISLLFLIFLGGISLFYFQIDMRKNTSNLVKQVQSKEHLESFEVSMIDLPNHSEKNKIIEQNINILFDVVPYDAILKEIEINEDSSTFVTNFVATSISISDMQIKLRNIYADSTLLLEHKNKFIINTIIQNNQLTSKFDVNKKDKKIKSKKENFLTTRKATEYLEKLTLGSSEIKLDSKEVSTYSTYNFSIITKIKSPKDFFDLVNKINIQASSIELAYPITFSKINNLIEVKYKLKFNQENKKSSN